MSSTDGSTSTGDAEPFYVRQATARHIALVLPLFEDHRTFHGRRRDREQSRLFLVESLRMQQVAIHVALPGEDPRRGRAARSASPTQAAQEAADDSADELEELPAEALGYTIFCARVDTLDLALQWILHDIRVTERGKMAGVGEALLEHADRVSAETPAQRVQRRMKGQLAQIQREKKMLEHSKGALERRLEAMSDSRPQAALAVVSAELEEHLSLLKREAERVGQLLDRQRRDMKEEQEEMAAHVELMRGRIVEMEGNAASMRARVEELVQELDDAEVSLRAELEAEMARAREEVRLAEQELDEQRMQWRLEQARLHAARELMESRMAEMAEAMEGLVDQLEDVEGKYLELKITAAEDEAGAAGRRTRLRNHAAQTDLTFMTRAPRSQALTHSRSQKVSGDRVGPHIDGKSADRGRKVAVLRRSRSLGRRRTSTTKIEFKDA